MRGRRELQRHQAEAAVLRRSEEPESPGITSPTLPWKLSRDLVVVLIGAWGLLCERLLRSGLLGREPLRLLAGELRLLAGGLVPERPPTGL